MVGCIVHLMEITDIKKFCKKSLKTRIYACNDANITKTEEWAQPDLNRRPPPCKGDVITPRP